MNTAERLSWFALSLVSDTKKLRPFCFGSRGSKGCPFREAQEALPKFGSRPAQLLKDGERSEQDAFCDLCGFVKPPAKRHVSQAAGWLLARFPFWHDEAGRFPFHR